MLVRINLFSKFFDTELLLYSWLYLKTQLFLFNPIENNIYLKPISPRWFYRTAFLIRKGLFNYSSYRVINNLQRSRSSNLSISLLKYRIIEVSFIFILAPFFFNLFYKDVFCENLVRFF